jgi:hypothetical protein
MNLTAGLLLALTSAAAINGGFFLQHAASGGLPALSVRRPATALAALFTHRRWLTGFSVGLLGWALYIVALDLAPLNLVQAVSAGGVGLLAVLVRADGTRLSVSDRAGVAASVGGLLLLALSLPGGGGRAPVVGSGAAGPGVASWGAPLGWILASALAAALCAGPAGKVLRSGSGLGAAAGLLYAAGDVATKAAVGGTSPVVVFALLVPACSGMAFGCLQLSFQRGTALATAGVSTLLTNLLPIIAGLTVFAEPMPAGLPGVLRAAGFAGVLLGATLLAR